MIMRRTGLLLLLLTMMFFTSFGQKTNVKPTVKPKETKASPYVMHVVKFGETLSKIAQKYEVTVTDILKANPSLTNDNLMPEQILRIPNKSSKKVLITSLTNDSISKPKVKVKVESTAKNIKYHTVETGQTLYAISKMYNVKIEDLQKWNALTDYNVKIGSQLVVVDPNGKNNALVVNETTSENKSENLKNTTNTTTIDTKPKLTTVKTEPKPIEPKLDDEQKEVETQKPDIQASDNATQKDLAKIYKEKANSGTLQMAKGTGAPMTTTLGAMESVYFAMHKWLPVGTIVKIKNMVNSKIVYAKVIGKLPDIDENKNVIVRYSLGVKKDLQLQNGKCYLQLEYAN